MHTSESRGGQRLRSLAAVAALTLLASGCGLLGTEDAGGAPSPTSAASIPTSAPSDSDSIPTTVDAAVTPSTVTTNTAPTTAVTPSTVTTTAPTTDSAGSDERPEAGVEGERGIGDPDFPTLGNGGFDVLRYELDLDVDPATGRQTSRTLISARAEADLAEFSLDFRGFDIESITVNGAEAAYVRTPTDIVITPATVIPSGSEMLVEVAYSGRPRTLASDTIGGDQLGWFTRPWGSYVSNEPEGASTWFPSNDHPTDKATYLFRVTVPSTFEVAVTGRFIGTEVIDDRTTWTWEMAEPMATYLAAVAIGDFEVVEETASDGMPITNFYPPDLADDADFDFGRTIEMIDYFVETFGPYPFSSYGVVVVPDDLFFAMENQTMSLFGADFVDGQRGAEDVVAHELAHQWFGNHVSPSTWGDIWLNEGFATYSEFLWADHINPQADVYANLRRIAAEAPDEVLNPPGDPDREDMFSSGVYFRGALTLHALRLTVGDDVFFEIVRTWLVRFGGRDASTADFIAVAEEVSGRELDEVINPWLYDAEVPELPS